MSYPEDYAGKIKTWEHDGMRFTIVRLQGPLRHHCGYVRFEQRPVQEMAYGGILTYVPVHGGITYAEQDDEGSMVYGFDCGHAMDEERPELRDHEWLGEECFRMGRAILTAAKYEQRYLATEDDQERAQIIQKYHDELKATGIEFNLTDNFGAMINVLFGEL